MDVHEALLQILGLRGIRAPPGVHGYGQRSPTQESPQDKPTAERVEQRQAEQERRRREALAANIDMNLQSDLMADFEDSI